ncbi:hypothetical protein FSS13T_18770 [Flavobacterium saliperosum S13]|uniref:Uncharacterized protein n=1 Tax=Flavobacterium saliperosum S13 TaxID=1341155 RepID=A0ABP3A1W5_9FLAO|nr:hypothetical protein FSS13T_18770 [Flavobacterium saliperosum S13]
MLLRATFKSPDAEKQQNVKTSTDIQRFFFDKSYIFIVFQ